MRNIIQTTCIAALATLAIGMSSVSATEKITVGGSTTIKPIIQKAIKGFRAANPGYAIAVGGGGSSQGVKGAASGQVQVGMASRAMKDKEKAAYPEVVPTIIGYDGIAIILNAANPIENVDAEMIQKIYTGQVTNWSEVGGNDAPIEVVTKSSGHGTTDMFTKFFGLEMEQVGDDKTGHGIFKLKGGAEAGTVQAGLVDTNKGGISQVVRKQNAITFVSIGSAAAFIEKGGKIKMPALNGVEASLAAVANGSFPLTRQLNLITKGQPSGNAKLLVDYLLSDAGRAIIEGEGFVAPQN